MNDALLRVTVVFCCYALESKTTAETDRTYWAWSGMAPDQISGSYPQQPDRSDLLTSNKQPYPRTRPYQVIPIFQTRPPPLK